MNLAATTAWILWCSLAAPAALQNPPRAPETFQPSYRAGSWTGFSLRQDVVYRVVTTLATKEGAARDAGETQNIGFEVRFRVMSTRPDGSRDMEVEYRGKWRETRRDEDSAASAVDYGRAVGKKMTFRLLPNGAVEDLSGHERFPEVTDPATGRAISSTDFQHDILYLFPRFPAGPISIGSTWDAPVFVLPNSTRPPTVYRYQVLDRVARNGEDCLRIVATYATKGSAERPAPDGGTMRVEGISDGIAVYYFSLERGMIVAKTLSWQGVQESRKGDRLVNAVKTAAMYECGARFDR